MATVEALKEKKDIELMKMYLKERNIRHYLLFVVGCNTGLRIAKHVFGNINFLQSGT